MSFYSTLKVKVLPSLFGLLPLTIQHNPCHVSDVYELFHQRGISPLNFSLSLILKTVQII